MPVRDRREELLARLYAVLQTVPGFVSAHRNRAGVPPEDQCPSVVQLDGDGHKTHGGGHKSPAPCIMQQEPQIFIALKPRKNAKNEDVGEELSAFRVAVVAAIIADDQLAAIQGENGIIEIRGDVTDLKTGSSIEGSMRLDLTFTYPLIMSEIRP